MVDFSHMEAGPVCTEALAWLGAEVIKVERPDAPDATRGSGMGGVPGDSLLYMNLNRNKKAITLNVRSPEGYGIVRDLIARADVFVENLGPGAIERLKLGYDEVRAMNPRVVYASIKGFADVSPLRDHPAFDPIAQATGGVMSLTGFPDRPPVRVQMNIADSGAGLLATTGIVAALYQRDRTGVGQRIAVAMQDAVLALGRSAFNLNAPISRTIERVGSGVLGGSANPARSYPTKPFGPNDHCFIFMMPSDGNWERLRRVIGRDDLASDPRFTTTATRHANRAALDEVILAWMALHTKHEAMEILGAAGIAGGAVLTLAELAADASLRARGMITAVTHPVQGDGALVGWPVQMSGSWVPLRPAPATGQDNDEVYGEILGIAAEQRARLKVGGVI